MALGLNDMADADSGAAVSLLAFATCGDDDVGSVMTLPSVGVDAMLLLIYLCMDGWSVILYIDDKGRCIDFVAIRYSWIYRHLTYNS